MAKYNLIIRHEITIFSVLLSVRPVFFAMIRASSSPGIPLFFTPINKNNHLLKSRLSRRVRKIYMSEMILKIMTKREIYICLARKTYAITLQHLCYQAVKHTVSVPKSIGVAS